MSGYYFVIFQVLLNRFNHQKNLDKPVEPPTTSDSEEATTEDDEVRMTSPVKSSPPRDHYPGTTSSLKTKQIEYIYPGPLYNHEG